MITLLGKNGSGKTYLANCLCVDGYTRIPSYTTRKPRIGEVSGQDYYFIDKEKFEYLLMNDFFVEYKKRNDNYYGLSLKNQNENTILIGGNIEVLEKKLGCNVIPIYIDVDINERYRRVCQRQDNDDLIERFHSENFSFLTDFRGIFIDNNSLNKQALYDIKNLLLTKEYRLESNYKFLERKVADFQLDSKEISENAILAYLKFEEYILRRGIIEKKEDLYTFYVNSIVEYLSHNRYCFIEKEDNFIINGFYLKKEKAKLKRLER